MGQIFHDELSTWEHLRLTGLFSEPCGGTHSGRVVGRKQSHSHVRVRLRLLIVIHEVLFFITTTKFKVIRITLYDRNGGERNSWQLERIFKRERSPLSALRTRHTLLALANSYSPVAEGSGEVDCQLTYGRKSTSSSAINCGMSVKPPPSSESYTDTATQKQQQQENKRKSHKDELRIFDAADDDG